MPVSLFLACGLQISTALQLFNWFSKRYLGLILGIWLSSEVLGLMTEFAVLGIYHDFPNNVKAYRNSPDKQSLLQSSGYLHIIVAILLMILLLLDFFHFYFHPFQLHIVVDLEEKTETDRAVLKKLAI